MNCWDRREIDRFQCHIFEMIPIFSFFKIEKNMKKLFLSFLLLIFASPVFADTTVFGMRLGKTTESEAKKMHTMEYAGVYKHSRGNMYHVRNTSIMEDLKSLRLVFDEKGLLVMIQAVFPREKEAEIFNTLRQKYKLAYTGTRLGYPRGHWFGDSRAGFDSGEAEIDMLTPNKSFDTTLLYTYKPFLDIHEKIQKEEEVKTLEQMDSVL